MLSYQPGLHFYRNAGQLIRMLAAMAATSHDVARMASVSQSTVSRALRGEPGMSAATRERIERAARTLSYVPMETGRSLATRATRRIGVVSAELTNPFYPELVEPLRAQLDRRGYRILLIPDSRAAPVAIERLVDGSLDGVILTTTVLDSSLPRRLADLGRPFVLLNREIDDALADTCVVANRTGAAQVARFIAELGHRLIGAVLGPADTSTSRDREAGFRSELIAQGLTLPRQMVRRGSFTYETGRAATLSLLDLPTPPSAIFCANDVLALGALNAAATRGVAVGAELTVVGFDDIALAAWDMFRLTTMRCDLTALADTAVELLTRRIEDSQLSTQRVVLPARLVRRGTHGPPRGS